MGSSSRPVAENTYVGATLFTFSMEWDSFADCLQPSAYVFTAPPSFFDPKIDESDTFAGNFFNNDLSTNNINCSTTSSSIAGSEIGFDEHLNNDDFSELIGNEFGDNLLAGRDALSVLSDDEIFSQIDASCSSSLQDNSVNSNNVNQYNNSDENSNKLYLPEEIGCQNEVDDIVADCYESFRAPAVPPNDYSMGQVCGQRLEEMELDIAKLKKEVDFNSDEDSLLADFFSEDDASEISPEYEKFLKSLLITPADDFDMNLNVFDRLDENGEDSSDEDSDCSTRLAEIVMADHSYSLPWGESACSPSPGCSLAPGCLPPPNSGEDSDSEYDFYSSLYQTIVNLPINF